MRRRQTCIGLPSSFRGYARALRRLAAREEGVSHYLGGLSPGDVVPPAEVWPVLRVTRLVWERTAWVPRHHEAVRKAHDLRVEGVVLRHVGVELSRNRLDEACGVGDDL